MRRLLLHQDGLALCSAAATMHRAGLLAPGPLDVDRVRSSSASPASVSASVRAMASAGFYTLPPTWSAGTGKVEVRPGADTAIAVTALLKMHDLMSSAFAGVDWRSPGDVLERAAACTGAAGRIRDEAGRRAADAEAHHLHRYIEGVIASIALPRFPRTGLDGSGVDDAVRSVRRFLELEDEAGPTGLGEATVDFQAMYGLAGSYAAAILSLPEWTASAEPVTPAQVNRALHRDLNVIASGAAHQGYFRAAAEFVRRAFDKRESSAQPAGIVDVGCGDGSWLRELFDVVVHGTDRGRQGRRHPIQLIGVDADPRALEVAKASLADLPIELLAGDVGDPAGIARSLEEATGRSAGEYLFVRAFVDHNRTIDDVGGEGPTDLGASETGMIYQDRQGRLLPESAVWQDWAEHLRRWRSVCHRHGMIVIEAHAVSSTELRRKRGLGHTLAFEFYHSLSGQSPIGWEAMQAIASTDGITSAPEARTFPRGSTTAISVQHMWATGA
jgi:hypothetical protein